MNTQKQIFIIVALFFLFAGACATYAAIDLPIRAEDQAAYQSAENIQRGALLFANNCRTCHGNQGQGGVGLPLNIDDYKNQDPLVLRNNRIKLTRTLQCGRAGTRMQPWLNSNGGALNARQIEHIVEFITAPGTADSPELAELTGGAGTKTNQGWQEAEDFAVNLNRETSVIVGGETLGTIAKGHLIGARVLSRMNGNTDPDQLLERGREITIPGYKGAPTGYQYKITKDNETLAKIADSQQVGAIILAELNQRPYDFDRETGRFTLLNGEGKAISGLFPGDTLALPEGAAYVVKAGDTIESIAAQHGLSVSAVTTDANRRVLVKEADPSAPAAGADPLASQRTLALPPDPAYTVQTGDTLGTIATKFGVEVTDLIGANQGLSADTPIGAGQRVRLPSGARYKVEANETLDSIAARLGTTAADLARLNNIQAGDDFSPQIVIELPKVDRYKVTGQTLGDVAQSYSNVTGESLGKANGIPANAVVMIGQSLKLPEDAWGNAPSDAINPGTACVQYAVPQSVFEGLPGLSTATPVARPTQVSRDVVLEAEAAAWVLVADGQRSEPNKGVALISAGTAVDFLAKVGIHNIYTNKESRVDPFQAGDTATLTFDAPGQILVECTIHPGMVATLFVE